MPCRSDYMEPTAREAASKREADLIVYANRELALRGIILGLSPNVLAAHQSQYGNVDAADEITATLCELLNAMNEDQKASIIYNGRDETARQLADWYDNHKKADAAREAAEQAAEQERDRAEALLTAVTKLAALKGRTGPDANTITLTPAEQAALIGLAKIKVAA